MESLLELPTTESKSFSVCKKVAAPILTRTPKLTHITPVLCQLHWLPIKARILFKILIITYKAINNIAPSYINSLVTMYQPVCRLRSADQLALKVPKSRLKTFGDWAFSVFDPKEWNKLPLNLRSSSSSSLAKFKSDLKAHILNNFTDLVRWQFTQWLFSWTVYYFTHLWEKYCFV